tara:strand:+ start:355 stop:780 length:426 start_codon:yes stop_codon:yes gene_type:complete
MLLMHATLSYFFIGLAAFACSCGGSPVALQTQAASIRLQKQAPSIDEFEPLGEVSCEFGANFGSTADNVRACRNDLRNKAHQLGATLVAIETEVLGTDGCANCVSMFATAYKPTHTAQEQGADVSSEGSDAQTRSDNEWED